MIRLENVCKSFRTAGEPKIVADNLTLTIPRGRSVGLLGRNGAGKSTLLKIMSGVAKPDSGRVVHDCRVSFPLGLSTGVHRDLTGRQNVRFVARIYGVDVDMLTEYVLDFSELGPDIDNPVRTYSSGMRARLSFGISMGIKFDTYLVDELTAVGDTNFKIKSRKEFSERLAGSDVIMVAHSGRTLREFCDGGIVLNDGRVEVFDDLEDAIKRHAENMKRLREGAEKKQMTKNKGTGARKPSGRGRRKKAASARSGGS